MARPLEDSPHPGALPSPDADDLLTAWCQVLLQSFADAGVTQLVVSPGSRSTPFLAAARAVPSLRCASVLDERSAAFFALGQGRASGRPSLLLCTSGSAAANYFPAVVEASASAVPLLVLTADRPFELQRCGAPQTLDQIRLYGDHARAFLDLGVPDPHPAALRGLRRLAAQAVAESLGPQPGAVHLNARARKPLEPTATPASMDTDSHGVWATAGALLAEPLTLAPPPRLEADIAGLHDLARELRGAQRPALVLGPAPLEDENLRSAVAAVAAACDAVVFAEATSQLRYGPWPTAAPPEDEAADPRCGPFDALVAAAHAQSRSAAAQDKPPQRVGLLPDVVLQIGPPPTSGAWLRWLDAHRGHSGAVCRTVIARRGWPDPHGSAVRILTADPLPALETLAARLREPAAANPHAATRRAWRQRLGQIAREIEDRAAAHLAEAPTLREGTITRELVRALPEGALLTVGNSLPVRHLDTWAPVGGPALKILCQRGVNGIDGITSGALGAASLHLASDAEGAAKGALTPSALLFGDVSFLHDLTGLHCARYVRRPLALVVIQNDGGRIFEQLPIAHSSQLSSEDLDFWFTPHGLSLDAAAALFHLPYARVTTRSDLQRALRDALKTPGVTVIEALVPPHGAAEDLAALRRAAVNSLDAVDNTDAVSPGAATP